MARDAIPVLVMVVLQIGFAGMNIASKLAMGSGGMNPIVLVAYRQIFGALAMAPVAFWLERKARPRMTMSIVFHIFLCSLTGATGNQVLYFVGLRNSTPTVACAVNNVLPAITFLLAVLFRQETVEIKRKGGQAKVVGTIMGISGALVLSLYHGKSIPIGDSGIHWKFAAEMEQSDSSNRASFVLGTLSVAASCVSLSTWFIIQTRLSKIFPAPYTSSTCMCFLASIECAIVALCFEHKLSAWSLRNPARLVPALYVGIVSTGLSFCLASWVIQRKGPLFVSVFNPLVLVIVAVLSWALLQEQLYVGTVVGSILIVLGLYSVLWAKKQDISQSTRDIESATNDETKPGPVMSNCSSFD